MPTLHAKLSASGSATWLNCPASVKASEQYPSSTSSFAEEGTCAHELSEICLKTGDTPDKYLGKTLKDAPTVKVDAEMVGYVQEYIEYCQSLGGERFVEEQVDFRPWVNVGGGFGTSDFITITGNVCHIVDLKYGRGLEVYAKENTQAMLYALGVYNEFSFMFDIDEFVLHIYQPRRSHFDEWSISTKDLLKWGEWVKERVALTQSDDAEFSPGEKQCQWCKHKANCVALQKYTEDVISSEFDNLDLPDVETVNVANVLKHKSLIESWLKAVEHQAYENIMNGEPVEGYKLVAGKSNRKWANSKEAENALSELIGDEAYERKLLSPAKAEKVVGKGKLDEYIIKPDGKPTLVPITDKRKPIDDVSCEFEEID